MAKQNEALFEESSQGAVSAVTAIGFVLSVLLLVGGMVLGSYAFGAESGSLLLFAAGLAAMTLGCMLPFTMLSATGK